jgi:hypothetical protein
MSACFPNSFLVCVVRFVQRKAGIVSTQNSDPEGPATSELDEGFFVVFLGPGADAELVSKFLLHMQPSKW